MPDELSADGTVPIIRQNGWDVYAGSRVYDDEG